MKKSKLLGLLGIENIIESLQKLIEVRIAIIKDEVEDKIAEKIAKFLPILFVFLFLSLVVLFASFTLGFYLAELLDSFVYGFGIVTLFYLLLTVIFYFLKDSKSLKNSFKKPEDQESENQ
ncbi:phage holin family protein [Marivirga arenosa]|uniref:Phage holin family protein n=1 Tax=Marivirga arenosa TaxID=3059076 RepID=A0AA49GIQ7_9BACT|nr:MULTISPECIES: phage holin family protein [unclassified Marivirga]WKK86028.1 phage holin family protein [Marivirga sp. ABR2-2]WNB17757.1 phage holin family protein [Marivirga sp. BKB1-2]